MIRSAGVRRAAAFSAAAALAFVGAGFAARPASAHPRTTTSAALEGTRTAPAPAASHAAVPAPRATFVVTIKRRTSGRTKVSSWTTIPIRPNGTLGVSHPASVAATAAASVAPPASPGAPETTSR